MQELKVAKTDNPDNNIFSHKKREPQKVVLMMFPSAGIKMEKIVLSSELLVPG